MKKLNFKYQLNTILFQQLRIISYSISSLFIFFLIYFYKFNIFDLINGYSINRRIGKIFHFPWTDVAENIAAGHFIVHGKIIYHDFVMNHFPGLPFLLSSIFNLFKLNVLQPSDYYLTLAYYLAFFISAYIQFFFIYLGVHLILPSKKKLANLFIVIFTLVYVIFYQFMTPMSETIITSISLFSTAHLINMFFIKRKFVQVDFFIAFNLCLLAIMIGLTSLPFFLCYLGLTAIFSIYCNSAKFFNNNMKSTIEENAIKIHVLFFALILNILIFFYFVKVPFDDFLYWNFEFNLATLKPNIDVLLHNIFNNFINFKSIFYHRDRALFGDLNILTLILIIFIFYNFRKHIFKKRFFYVFMFLFLFFYFSFFWRIESGYKVFPSIGFLAALFIYAASISSKFNDISYQNHSLSFSSNKIFYTIIFLGLTFLLTFRFNAKNVIDQEASNICSIQSSEIQNCGCLVSDVWGPQIFLNNNYLPCKGLFPTLPPSFFQVDRNNEYLISFVKNNNAFILMHDHEFNSQYLPEDVNIFYKLLDCSPFNQFSKLCYFK